MAARRLRLLLASPSDLSRERDAVAGCIAHFNATAGRAMRLRVDLLRWEDSVPDIAGRAQEVINSQLVDAADIVVGIFWTRFGSPTGKFSSGTEEEIRRAIRLGKRVLVYFSNREVKPRALVVDQLSAVEQFRHEFPGLYGVFQTLDEFKDRFEAHLRSVCQAFLQGTPWSMGEARFDSDYLAYVTSVEQRFTCSYIILNTGGDTRILRRDVLKVVREQEISRTANCAVYSPRKLVFDAPVARVVQSTAGTRLTAVALEPSLHQVSGRNWYHYRWYYTLSPKLGLHDLVEFETDVSVPEMESDIFSDAGTLFHVNNMTNVAEAKIAIVCDIPGWRLGVGEQYSEGPNGKRLKLRTRRRPLTAPDGQMISWIHTHEDTGRSHCLRIRAVPAVTA